jgi:hypothetical protein
MQDEHKRALARRMIDLALTSDHMEMFGVTGMEPFLQEQLILWRQGLIQTFKSKVMAPGEVYDEEAEKLEQKRLFDLIGGVTSVIDGTKCGLEAGFKLFSADPKTTYDNCQAENAKQRIIIIVGCSVGGALLLACCCTLGICFIKQGLKTGGNVQLTDLALGPGAALAKAAARTYIKPSATPSKT